MKVNEILSKYSKEVIEVIKELDETKNDLKFDKVTKELDTLFAEQMKFIEESYVNGFSNGAEFGYNKANEWHKPSEKLPEECSLVLAYLFEETEPTICEYVVSNQWECLPERNVFCSNDQVRLWKEIVLPKEVGK